MAAINRPTEATYVIHDEVTVLTNGEYERKNDICTRKALWKSCYINTQTLLLCYQYNMNDDDDR